MLTNSFLSRIYYRFDFNRFFDLDDFSIIIPESDTYPQELTIKYLFDENYYFNTSIYSSTKFFCECSPGLVMKTQKKQVASIDTYVSEIGEWLERMEDEFKSTPLARKVVRTQSQVEDLISKVDAYFEENKLDSDELFSHSEMEDMENKLEEFKASIEEKLAEQIKEKESLGQEVSKLFKEVDFLKRQVQTLTKKNWFKAFCSKTGKLIRNNPETAKAIAHTAKECLPESIKMSIPEGATEVMNTLLEEQQVK
ncbi:hypothetical protein COD67_13015 [Bacillus cereus]|nr:hypothetical protein COD67_13015 [Bacillus cereus]